ncbi:MAG TPA: DUF4230 domain-containing protein [Polyangiales bacterium]|nr:DUF4230 domain-containing protein [Polyangiales bacterium]
MIPLAPNERLSDTPTVLVAVKALARLEGVAFHMERVIDLKDRQSHVFGLVQAEDSILLVASGDVVAGVDLAKMQDGDVTIEPAAHRAKLRLPAPELLSVRLDNERTYVHTRKTDLLAQRKEEIETRARQLAEASIREGALSAGVLDRAKQSTEHTLTVLVRSLGYDQVEIIWADGPAPPLAEQP